MNDAIDTKKLRMFVTTVKEGSMRQASKLLFVTPSALSHGIKSLEENLNTQLFDRNGPVLATTSAGKQFFNEALDILSRLDQAIERFSTNDLEKHVQLHIGTTNTGCSYLFPGIVREFRESFPNVSLKLEVGDTDYLINRMNEAKVDIIIAPIQRNYPNLVQTEIGHDELVYIVHPEHPWAKAGKINPTSLSNQQLILPAVNSHTYNLIDAMYREMRVPLEPFIELSNEEAIKQLVSLNIGTGILPKWIAQKEIENGSLLAFPLSSRSLLRRWTISHRANMTLTFPEFLFIGTTKSVAYNLISKIGDVRE
ncbi:MAG: LysR family transcriptional regulator [Akkermansiaceae bacterium]